MDYESKTPEEYMTNLPEERKEAMQKLRKVLKDNLSQEIQETMSYGMIIVEPLRGTLVNRFLARARNVHQSNAGGGQHTAIGQDCYVYAATTRGKGILPCDLTITNVKKFAAQRKVDPAVGRTRGRMPDSIRPWQLDLPLLFAIRTDLLQ